MRVLLITDGIHPFVMGGMQKHSWYLAKFLAAKAVRVHVVHCTPSPPVPPVAERPEFAGFDHRFIRFQSLPFPAGPRWPFHYLRKSRRYSEQAWQAVRPLLEEFDLIYAQGLTAAAFIQAKRRGEHDLPVTVNLHGLEMFQTAPSAMARAARLPLRRMARSICTGADAVFSFGGAITDILRRLGVPPERILECPIGMEDSWLVPDVPPTPGRVRSFLFVGRDERRKGVNELMQAIRLLPPDEPFRFGFIGPLAPEHRLDDPRFTYHGAIGEEGRMQQLMREADVLVCPSHSEGMPTVIMEAMASRLAVIATAVGAVPQQVQGNGWLLPSPEPAALARSLQEAIRMPENELDAMKARSLARVRERFTWERVIERKIGLLQGVLHQRG